MTSLSFNKKAQGNIFFLLMIGVTFAILALALTPALTEVTTDAMNSPQLDCANESISDQNKAVCDSVDIMPFLYFGALLGMVGILLKGAIQ